MFNVVRVLRYVKSNNIGQYQSSPFVPSAVLYVSLVSILFSPSFYLNFLTNDRFFLALFNDTLHF